MSRNFFQLLKNIVIFTPIMGRNIFQLLKNIVIFTPIMSRNIFQLLKNIVFLLQLWVEIFFSKRRGMNIKYLFLEIFFSC
jgi:hypothetical protein